LGYLKNNNMDNKFEKNSKPVTMEEMVSLHDEWWNSLSDKDKEKLFQEQKEAEDYFYNIKQQDSPK
jgi:TRAP-type C4-dicarboxylate transport system substrate-binding protein|tara:strand:- start:61 stop:258 length:198 start_codon:yes stop_codon:yes gene_type:complete